jgi:opacity protein-like surface antigen
MVTHNKCWSYILAIVGIFALGAAAGAQTSVGVSVYGAFSGTTTGNNVQQSPSNSAGGIIELRHISNPILGYEATYSYNRANQSYRCTTNSCPVISPVTVPANAHQVTVDWVPSIHVAPLRPFGVLGIGLLLNQPTGNTANTTTSTKAVYVYGAGLDWGVLPHLGLRFQYRGNLYKSPDLTKLYTSVDRFRNTSEPMIGAYLSF